MRTPDKQLADDVMKHFDGRVLSSHTQVRAPWLLIVINEMIAGAMVYVWVRFGIIAIGVVGLLFAIVNLVLVLERVRKDKYFQDWPKHHYDGGQWE